MTLVGKNKLDHPALGSTGGAGLHTSIEALWTKVSDNLSARWQQYLLVQNSGSFTFEHNFKVPFADLRVHVYSVSGGTATRLSGWTVAATSGYEQTKVDVTAPASGGPWPEVYLYVSHEPMDDKLSLSGGTMTGNLVLNANPSANLGAATKQYVDTADALKVAKSGDSMTGALAMGSNKITGLGAPSADTDASTKKYVDDQDALKVSKAGDSMTGALAMGTNKITGLGTPTVDTDASTKKYVDDQAALKLSLTGGSMTGVLNMGNGTTNYKISNMADPASASDAATKNYVDSVAQGLDPKASVRAATKTNITLSGAQTIDGVNVIAGDRVLVKNQSTQSQNGIYLAASDAWSRASDMDSWTEVPGAFVFVEEGSQADTGWVCSADQGGTIGTTAITWISFAGAGSVTSGNAAIGVSGTTVSLVTDNSTLEVGGSGAQIKDLGVTNAKLAGSITQDKLAGSIPDSKLDTISTTGKVSGSAINSGTIGGSTEINTSGSVTCGNLTTTGNTTLGDATTDTFTVAGDATFNGTGSVKIASGTTAQRPGTPANGMIRYNSDQGSFEGYASGAWSGIGGGGTVDKVTQNAHGFALGDVLYINLSGVYVKALASAANTAEVVGMVSRVVDTNNFEITLNGEVSGLSGLTVGEVYFLSDTAAGGTTKTEPTTVGYVSLPVGVASSATTMYVAPKRGVVVGGANARTQLTLANNTTATIQNVSGYDAGELAGWIYIDATTDYRFYVQAQFVRGADNNYDVSYQTSGDTPPAGFSLSMTNAGLLQYTMPNLAGFSATNSVINYALNAPAVGTNFPLSVNGSNVLGGTPTVDTINEYTSANGVQLKGRTSGAAISSGFVGELFGTLRSGTNGFTYSTRSTTNPVVGAYGTLIGLSLNKGVWLIGFQTVTKCSSNAQIDFFINVGGTAVTQVANTSISTGTSAVFSTILPVVISADTTAVNLNGQSNANNMSNTCSEAWAIRIA